MEREGALFLRVGTYVASINRAEITLRKSRDNEAFEECWGNLATSEEQQQPLPAPLNQVEIIFLPPPSLRFYHGNHITAIHAPHLSAADPGGSGGSVGREGEECVRRLPRGGRERKRSRPAISRPDGGRSVLTLAGLYNPR